MGEGDQRDLVKRESTDLATISEEPDIERLRAEIDATRERIRSSIVDLQDEIEEKVDWIEDKVDWQGWVREHPWQTVGVAFALGFLLGSG